MIEDLLEVWRTHDEINFFLLEQIPDAGLTATTLLKNGRPFTGRSVVRVPSARLHSSSKPTCLWLRSEGVHGTASKASLNVQRESAVSGLRLV